MKIYTLLSLFFLIALAGCKTPPKAVVAPAQAAPVAAVSFQFTNISPSAGVHFSHVNGAFGAKMLPETMGSGAAFIDYDNDGYPDLFLVQSRDWTDAEANAFKNGSGAKYPGLVPASRLHRRTSCALYHNNGNGTFSDVTKQAGLDIEIYGMGVAVGDYDNDGKPDLYVTALGRNYLFHNEDGGKFKDVAEPMGVKDSGWSMSAAWVDYDKDGKLDLFVCHYVEWTPATDIFVALDGHNKSYSRPDVYSGQVSRLYHNDGARFTDVSEKAGIHNTVQGGKPRKLQGKSLGVSICDYDNDGWPDIVVANDTEPNYLFRNNGNGTFMETAIEAGIALSEAGIARAAMGVDACDMDHSGRESLLFGNFSNQMLGLYQNRGGGLFIDVAPQSEVGRASLQYLAFGCLFVDIDNDGWPDIFVANGHVEDDIHRVQRDVDYEERPLLFHHEGLDAENRCRFTEVGLQSGEALKKPVVGRGLACADIDLDGDLDVVLTVNGGPVVVFRNDVGNKNNAIRLTLEGTKSNRSAIGALIEAKAGAETLRSVVRSGSSYLSQSELPVTMGLGQQPSADLTIRWPSGKVTELKGVAANQNVVVNEDKGIVKQQPMKQ